MAKGDPEFMTQERAQKTQRLRFFPYATLTLSFACLVLFTMPFALELVGLDEMTQPGWVTRRVWSRLGASLGFEANLVEPWRWATANFLHFGLSHLAVNCLVLTFLGISVERWIGSRRMAGLFILSGIAGTLASSYFQRASLTAGASAGIFGLAGGFLVLLLRRRKDLARAQFWWSFLPLAISMTVLLVWGDDLVGMGEGVKIDHWGHAGGALGGALVALTVRFRRPSRLWALATGLGIAGLIGVGIGVVAWEGWHFRYGPQRWDSLDPLPLQIQVDSHWHRLAEPRSVSWVLADHTVLQVTRIPATETLVATLDRLETSYRETFTDMNGVNRSELVYREDFRGRGLGGVIVIYAVEPESEFARVDGYRWIELGSDLVMIKLIRSFPSGRDEAIDQLKRVRFRR